MKNSSIAALLPVFNVGLALLFLAAPTQASQHILTHDTLQPQETTVHLSPRIRSIPLTPELAAPMPLHHWQQLATQQIFIDAATINRLPHIVASHEHRALLSDSDIAYVHGDLQGHKEFHVLGIGQALKNAHPDKTITYPAVLRGTVRLEHISPTPDDAHRFVVTQAQQEIKIGDRLMPVATSHTINPVSQAVSVSGPAQVIAISDGATHAGQHQIVIINRGRSSGMTDGSLLQLHHPEDSASNTNDAYNKFPAQPPDEHYGNLLVLRTFDHLS